MKPLRILLSSILVLVMIGCAKEQPAEAPESATAAPAASAPSSTALTPENAAPASTEAMPGEAEPSATATATEPASRPEDAPVAAAETKPATSSSPETTLVATGKDLFRSKCSSCHGKEGKGDTQIGRTRKLRDFSSAGVQSLSDEKLAEILRGGDGSLSARTHKSKALSDDEIHAVIAFIRSLR